MQVVSFTPWTLYSQGKSIRIGPRAGLDAVVKKREILSLLLPGM
jgi:hypothetical protein